MKVVRTVAEWQKLRCGLASKTLGFVPTMGALHAGHVSLLNKARKENDISVLSIYLNPTQFDNATDLDKYPVSWQDDLEVAQNCGVDYVFAPDYPQMYPDDYCYRIQEVQDSQILCGASRPGHFDGVLTVVMKLLQLVRPERAYFGEKDYQQLRLVEGLVRSFFLKTEVIPCPIVREPDGLAMSSRNKRLTSDEREKAPMLYQVLKTAPKAQQAEQQLEELGFRVDYVQEHWGRRFVAAYLGSVRLIDNVAIV